MVHAEKGYTMNKKYTYAVSGTCRKVGAIGTFGKFRLSIDANTEEEAREEARGDLYNAGNEHVLIKKVELLRLCA